MQAVCVLNKSMKPNTLAVTVRAKKRFSRLATIVLYGISMTIDLDRILIQCKPALTKFSILCNVESNRSN